MQEARQVVLSFTVFVVAQHVMTRPNKFLLTTMKYDTADVASNSS
jgi:hypothetical protein